MGGCVVCAHASHGKRRNGTGISAELMQIVFPFSICPCPVPWEDIPEECEWTVIPSGLWAQFKCKGPLPDSLQSVNTQIWSEWLPTLKGYTLAGNYSLEIYGPPTENPEDYEGYIWIPLKKE